MFTVLALSIFISIVSVNGNLPSCNLNLDNGYSCAETSDSSSIRWFYDNETNLCLPFKFLGCGGNSNRFKTHLDCVMRCIPADYGWCALRQPAYKTASGETVRCDKDESCPDSYKCKRVAFFSICCPRHTEELFYTNVAPDEIDEKTVMMDDVNLEGRPGYSAPLLLKSCDNDICPENSNCVQQEVLAYCSRY